MRLSSQEKSVNEILRNISGESIETVNNVLKALMYYTLMNYSEGENTLVPYFGRFSLKYKGDIIKNNHRVADIEANYFPSDEVKLNIGVLEDVKSKGGDITEVPCIKDFMREINIQLKCAITENNLEDEEK
jgi:hypothetical protein